MLMREKKEWESVFATLGQAADLECLELRKAYRDAVENFDACFGASSGSVTQAAERLVRSLLVDKLRAERDQAERALMHARKAAAVRVVEAFVQREERK